MVLESLISPLKAEKSSWQLLFFGFFYASLAILIGIWVFDQYAGMVMVFLLVMACLPLLYRTMKLEEKKFYYISKERKLLAEHSKAISFLLFLFIGASIAFTLWYVVLPEETTNLVYSPQSDTIMDLNQRISGGFQKESVLIRILTNNLRVMIFCLLFSFLYGSGAIFILMWNASVIGTAAGNFIRVHMAEYAHAMGFQLVGGYLYASSLSVFRYAVHGIPEILAYIIAGLAGAIISAAVINHDITTKNFERIMVDVSDLILLALFVLVIAGVLEVYVTPLFF